MKNNESLYNESGIEEGLLNFLEDTALYTEQLDSISFETAVELYDLLDEAADIATLHINEIDTELRVKICDKQDMVLERIVDDLPPFEHTGGNQLKVFSPAIGMNEYVIWGNVGLMKDCGLAVYMLAKEIGASPILLFGSKPSDYPYLSVLPEVEMLYHDGETDLKKAYEDFLLSHYAEIDVLMFHGFFNPTLSFLDVYRRLRPDGKVYIGLDMNLWWMTRVYWDSLDGIRAAQQSDIIAAASLCVRDAMNRRSDVKFPCRWLTNGFFNPTNLPVIADPDIKENIILTVGRIGSRDKNNEELLTAFALCSNALSDWSLRLVGPIDPRFQPFIDFFFTERPDLKERVIFTGAITDKKELYNEYARAKIFALTSPEEGFPNVYAEALFHGCMFVLSNVDAADEMIKYGELGTKYTHGDVNELSEALMKVCSGADWHGMQKHIPNALDYATKYFDWTRNAKKLAYMLFNK